MSDTLDRHLPLGEQVLMNTCVAWINNMRITIKKKKNSRNSKCNSMLVVALNSIPQEVVCIDWNSWMNVPKSRWPFMEVDFRCVISLANKSWKNLENCYPSLMKSTSLDFIGLWRSSHLWHSCKRRRCQDHSSSGPFTIQLQCLGSVLRWCSNPSFGGRLRLVFLPALLMRMEKNMISGHDLMQSYFH